jgi:hypothetical protein
VNAIAIGLGLLIIGSFLFARGELLDRRRSAVPHEYTLKAKVFGATLAVMGTIALVVGLVSLALS